MLYITDDHNPSTAGEWPVVENPQKPGPASSSNRGARPYRGRKIIIAKKGVDRILLKLSDIAYFFTREKLLFAVDRDGKKFLIDHTLANLEETLNPDVFFRINRQSMVNIHFIKRFRTFERLRIEIELDLAVPLTLLTSQNATIAFRKWVYTH